MRGIGEAEMRLLSFLAERGATTVREAWEEYGQAQGYVRTTVQQMMERLRKKELLTRAPGPGGWRYAATSPKAGILKGAVDRFVRESLGGSLSPFVQYLSEARELSDDDMAALRELVRRMDDEERP